MMNAVNDSTGNTKPQLTEEKKSALTGSSKRPRFGAARSST